MRAKRIHNSTFARKRRRLAKNIIGVKWLKQTYERRRRRAHEKRLRRKMNKTFKNFNSLGKSGVATGNSIAIEVNGKVYETLKQAKEDTGKSLWWLKKHGKIL